MKVQDADSTAVPTQAGPDQVGSEVSERVATDPESLGLALSGGGVRATLFSLGVIIGLIETGLHQRVRCVASVSGGSILNAALAHAPSLGSFSTVEEFQPLASRLAGRLAWQGAFAFDWRSLVAGLWYVAQVIGRSIGPLVVIFMVLASLSKELPDDWHGVFRDFSLSNEQWLYVCGIALVTVLLSALSSRGLLQEAKYASLLGAVAGLNAGPFKLRLYVRDWGARSRGDGPGVMHVLVATDLLSGEPVYFSNQFVHCQPYGWSTPEEILTKEALYSSAAFPAVFPPKRLRLSRLKFQNGEMPGPLPRIVRLADGGVYNNLGTNWFEVLQEQSQALPPMLWPFGELKVNAPRIEVRNVIVVNASAPSRRVQRLGPFTLARIMSVLYDNTVRPRVQEMQGQDRPLINIQESPIELVEDLTQVGGDVGRRAEALATKLEGKTKEFWSDFTRDTAGTKTKLSRAGRRTAARLMLHGYLLSLVLLHVRFGARLPGRIRGEEYFLDLVPRPWGRRESPMAASESTNEVSAAVDKR